MNIPENGFYRHYKYEPEGTLDNYTYEVVGIARHTEEENSFSVLYRPLYETDWFPPANFQARPLPMFMETVEKNGGTIPRFHRLTDAETIARLEKIRDEMYP